jgi:hypothetical protein
MSAALSKFEIIALATGIAGLPHAVPLLPPDPDPPVPPTPPVVVVGPPVVEVVDVVDPVDPVVAAPPAPVVGPPVVLVGPPVVPVVGPVVGPAVAPPAPVVDVVVSGRGFVVESSEEQDQTAAAKRHGPRAWINFRSVFMGSSAPFVRS